ncbi:polysaccharide deacetylase family protein [Luteimicrobium sp. DT211]|uniref:polysaccharide deacetylase family protein n=1 Tax=Luteimicrobium sp. DT211 TaxID=3393412 RepID=UPI003CE98682
MTPAAGPADPTGRAARQPVVVVGRKALDGHEADAPRLGGRAWWRARRPRAVAALGAHGVDATERVVAITYDDGPHPEHTPRILDVLARRGVRATFFTIGAFVRERPELVRRIVAEGHALGLHGADHRSLAGRDPREVVATTLRAKAHLEDVAQVPVTMFRPPYGVMPKRQGLALWRAGLEPVMWSGDAADWTDRPVDDVVDDARRSVFPGAMLLLHDNRADPETLGPGERLPAFDKGAVLDRLLDLLERDHYRTRTVPELLASYPRVVVL